jgi:hypothetical protein
MPKYIKLFEEDFAKSTVTKDLMGAQEGSNPGKWRAPMNELTFKRVDPDTGNFIYLGTDGNMYVDIEGVIHDVTDEGEPLGPVRNVVIKKGEPIYNKEDRFGRNPGSKIQEDNNQMWNSARTKMEFGRELIAVIRKYKKRLDPESIHDTLEIAYHQSKNNLQEDNKILEEATVREHYIITKGDHVIDNASSSKLAMDKFSKFPAPKRPSEIHNVWKLIAEQKLDW